VLAIVSEEFSQKLSPCSLRNRGRTLRAVQQTGQDERNPMESEMTSTKTIEQQAEIRVLESAEIDYVAGGYLPTVDVTGMPDRAVGGCGTMWLLRQRGKIFTGTQH
jgi:hypothetical protein